MSKKKTVEAVAYDAYDIWAAAVYAQRINGAITKKIFGAWIRYTL